MSQDPFESPQVTDPHAGYDETLHFRRLGLALYLLTPVDLIEWLVAPGRISRVVWILVWVDMWLGWDLRHDGAWISIVIPRLLIGFGLTLALFLPSGNYGIAAAFSIAHLGVAFLAVGKPSSMRQLPGLALTILIPLCMVAFVVLRFTSAS